MEKVVLKLVRVIVLLLLIVVLAVEFWALRMPRSLHLPEQQQVITNNPKIGVHTRLAGVADEAYIAQTFQQVREMGASWVVDLFPWSYAQPRSRYGYDWNGADMMVAHARRQGLTVVARIDIVPQWARPQGTTDRYLDPEHYIDYADFVVAFLERYRPQGVRHVIIWNEPNLSIEWGRRKPDPAAYAELLKVVYPRVKAAVPDAIVIAGALSPQPDMVDNDERMNDFLFMRRFYEAGGGDFYDMWGVHTYGYRSPNDAPPDPEQINFRRVELVHQELQALGDGDKPIIVTEGGWNDNVRWTAAVLPSQRLRWTVGAYQQAQEWEWLTALCLWQFNLPNATHTYHDNWTFVASDGTPKAIYWAVRESAVPNTNVTSP
jgi:hypothetical protein